MARRKTAETSVIVQELARAGETRTHHPPYYAYLRVSSDEQKRKKTIETQRTDVTGWALRTGVKITKVIADDGLSATTIAGRPGFTQLLTLIESGNIGTLLVSAPDRLTRADDWNDRARIMNALKKYGTILVTTSYGELDPNSEQADMMFSNLFTLAAMERKRIRARSFAGKMRALENGRLPSGRAPYGRHFDTKTGTWSLVPEEVTIYRKIASLYLEGNSTNGIALLLNRQSVPSSMGKLWTSGTIRELLHSRGAIGEYTCFGKTIPIPPVLDVDTFKHVNEALTTARTYHGAPPREPRLLGGLMICAHCGSGIHVHHRGTGKPRYYWCGSSHPNHLTKPNYVRPPCAMIAHRADDLDAQVWVEVQRMLSDPSALSRAQGNASKGDDSESRITAAEKKLQGLDREQQSVMRLYRRGLASESDLEKQLLEIQKLRKAEEQELTIAKAHRDVAESREVLSKDLETRVRQLAGKLAKSDLSHRRELLKALFPKTAPYGLRLRTDGTVEGLGTLTTPNQSTASFQRTSQLISPKEVTFRLRTKAPKRTSRMKPLADYKKAQ